MGKRVKSPPGPPPQPPAPKRVHTPASVSFRHVRAGGEFCLSAWTGDECKLAVDALRRLTTMTWQQVLTTAGKGGSKTGLGYTPYPDSALTVPRPADVDKEAVIAGIRASQKLRIFGFYSDHVFYVIWFDREHAICPT